MLNLQPISQREAFVFIRDHHRHHEPPVGCIFAVALNDGEQVVGVATVGRPVARMLQDGFTAEVTRLCVLEEQKNAASKLYSACWRTARAIGYRRLITYTLASESGISVKAAGWTEIGKAGGGTWHRPNCGRPRVDTHPIEQKRLWERVA